MKSYKEMKEMIEAQNKAIEYLFQTVDDHCKRIEELEKYKGSILELGSKEDHVQNN